MTATKFEEIKQKIEDAKQKKSKAEGAIARIMEQLKKDYGINSIEEAQLKADELKSNIASGNKKLEKLYAELDNVTDWEDI